MRVQDFKGLTDKVIMYFDLGGKDYNEVSAEIRNLVNATIQDAYQELSGDATAYEVRNKSVAIDKVRELHKAGADTTIDEIMLRTFQGDDLFGDFDLVKQTIGEAKILASFVDPVDGFKKAYFADRDLEWKSTDGVVSKIGSGFAKRSFLSKSKAGTLVLSDLISAPTLFSVYPQLRNLGINLVKSNSDELGSADWENWTVTLNYNPHSDVVKDVLLHELQHIVQGEHQWAGGGNPETIRRQKPEVKDNISEVKKQIEVLEYFVEKQSAGISPYTAMEKLKYNLRNDLASDDPDVRARVGMQLYIIDSSYDLWKLYQADAIRLLNEDLQYSQSAYPEWSSKTAFQVYQEIAGEDESRRVVHLSYLTDDEIRSVFLERPVYAGSDLADSVVRLKTDSRSGELFFNTTQVSEDYTTDAALFASYDALKGDDLKAVIKKRRVKAPQVIKEGPYQAILKTLPKAKAKRTRNIDPVKVEKRRQDLFDFIDNMKQFKEVSDRKGIPLSDLLLKAGFTPQQVKRDIAKFHRHQSKFRQSETIIRLAEVAGLRNEETGAEGLYTLIRSMFPDKTVSEVQPDGTIKDVVYPGSDGSIQSLDVIARDRLINHLQNLIVSQSGEKFDIDNEMTLAETAAKFREDYQARGGWKKVVDLVKLIQSSAADFLDTTAPGR
jgi:hypothetical protein